MCRLTGWLTAAVTGVALLAVSSEQVVVWGDDAPPRKEHHDQQGDERDEDDLSREHGEQEHGERRDDEHHPHRDREDHRKRDSHHKSDLHHKHDGHHEHEHQGDHRSHAHPHLLPHEEVRDAVGGELHDVARALRRIDQSYGYRGMVGCGSYTAGSAFMDWHAKGLTPPPGGRRVLPPPPLILGGCRSCRARLSVDCSERRYCGGCGQYVSRAAPGRCGCEEVGTRPAWQSACDECGVDWSITEEVGCTILDRRICTGCGHVYPANEQPNCRCHRGASGDLNPRSSESTPQPLLPPQHPGPHTDRFSPQEPTLADDPPAPAQ